MAAKLQLFVPTYRIEETLAEIRKCLEAGWTGLGFKTDEFETAWCAYTKLPHAHFVNSATAALHLAVELLREERGWQPGDEVITTPLTFVSTNHVILQAGLKPVFADVDTSLNLDPDSIAKKMSLRTRAVMFVGMGGNPANLVPVAKLCREHGLALILDAAHMAGTRDRGVHVGPEADVTCFSFQAVKNLPTADSGMVCFADAELDKRARRRSWLGISRNTYDRTSGTGTYKWDYDVEAVGYKYNGNSVMAAMGLVALRYLDQDNAYRRQLAQWYDEAFARAVVLDVVPVMHWPGSSRHLYQVRAKHRDALMVYMNSEEIYPGVHYKDSRAYRMYAPSEDDRASNASKTLVSLPMHTHVTYDDVTRVVTVIKDFYGKMR